LTWSGSTVRAGLGSRLSEFWKDREAQWRGLMSLHGTTPLDGLDADLIEKDCRSMKKPSLSGQRKGAELARAVQISLRNGKYFPTHPRAWKE
jgi:hypothetical protein